MCGGDEIAVPSRWREACEQCGVYAAGGGLDEGEMRKKRARAPPGTLGFTFQGLGGRMASVCSASFEAQDEEVLEKEPVLLKGAGPGLRRRLV